jgi:hypothetical protein
MTRSLSHSSVAFWRMWGTRTLSWKCLRPKCPLNVACMHGTWCSLSYPRKFILVSPVLKLGGGHAHTVWIEINWHGMALQLWVHKANTLRRRASPSLCGFVLYMDSGLLYDTASVAAKTRHFEELFAIWVFALWTHNRIQAHRLSMYFALI